VVVLVDGILARIMVVVGPAIDKGAEQIPVRQSRINSALLQADPVVGALIEVDRLLVLNHDGLIHVDMIAESYRTDRHRQRATEASVNAA
jgi:hypothetical protein